MARLSELSDRSAVDAAVAEFKDLGRGGFLEKYEFEESRDYFARIDDALIDYRPLVAAIWAHQHPSRAPLRSGDLSGGLAQVESVLGRLDIQWVSKVQLDPPQLGASHGNRTAVAAAYGGDNVAGIVRFPGELTVNVFSDAEGPYADDPPTLVDTFGYRGDGLSGDHRLDIRGNKRLEEARLSTEAVRFWYKPVGGSFSFLTWIAVVGRVWVAGVGEDGNKRSELEWQLRAVPGRNPDDWAAPVRETIEVASKSVGDPSAPEARSGSSYAELVERVEARGPSPRRGSTVRIDYARSAAARRAVLLRSGGECEGPKCTGMPRELNRRGEPILDVDHIHDLGLGGDDHPRNMAALCPNCHACKTRGQHASQWRKELLKKVAVADESARSA